MRKKLRNALIPALAFASISYIYPGFRFGDTNSIVYASAAFSFFCLFVKPFIKILSIPVNLFTFGLFSLLANMAALYLISLLIPGFDITAFELHGIGVMGLDIRLIQLNSFLSLLIVSLLLGFFNGALLWVFS